jgi:hypothetical protein
MSKYLVNHYSDEVPDSWCVGEDPKLVCVSKCNKSKEKILLWKMIKDLVELDLELDVTSPTEIRDDLPGFLFSKEVKGKIAIILFDNGEIHSSEYNEEIISDEVHSKLSKRGIVCRRNDINTHIVFNREILDCISKMKNQSVCDGTVIFVEVVFEPRRIFT